MEKTLTRKIGYKPSKTSIPVKKEVAAPKKIVAKSVVASGDGKIITAKVIVDWIIAHPMFAWGPMCTEIGFNRGNFCMILKMKEPVIKQDVIDKIVAVIKEYGFKS